MICELRVMKQGEGDVTIRWNPDNPWEVQEAKTQFDRLRKKGHIAHKMKGGEKTAITEFDPMAKVIVMGPIPVGG